MVATMSTSAPRRMGYRPALDGLRAVSVLAVILYHAGVSWMPGGFLGVEVFFVVSGFLITSLLLEERGSSGRINLRQFWVRRARRLLPALYLLLAVVSVASLLVYRDAAGRLGGDVLAALLYVLNWWQIHLDQSYFAEAGRPPLLLHLWSLAIEEQFYVVFPPLFALAMVRFGHRTTRRIALGLAFASAAWMAILYDPGVDTSRVYFGTDTRASGLLLGVVLAMVWTPSRSSRAAPKAAGPTMDAVGVVALAVLGWFFVRVNAFDPFVYRGGFLLLGVVTIVLMGVLTHPAAKLPRVMSWAPLVWVGVRSYSLYLWHWPIFVVTRPGLDVPLTGLPLFVLRMALTFGAAELSYRYVETPLRNGALGSWWTEVRTSSRQRRLALQRRGLAIGGVAALLVVVVGVGLHAAASDPSRDELELAAAGLDLDELEALGIISEVDEDPSAPVTTEPATTSPTTTPTTSPAAGNGGTPPTAVPAPDPTPAPAPAGGVVAVGDSVMLGAQSAMVEAMPGIRVDAKVARQFDSVLSVVQWYLSERLVPGALVVHAGTNGTFTDDDLDRLMDAAGDRRVLLVNAKVARQWEGLVNERMAAAAQRYPNAVLVDWHSAASSHPDWFTGDGAHLTPAGAAAFAELIRSSL